MSKAINLVYRYYLNPVQYAELEKRVGIKRAKAFYKRASVTRTQYTRLRIKEIIKSA